MKMIKFNKYHVTNGQTKARVSYSIGNRLDGRACVTLYARDYGRTLGYLFQEDYKNDTDMMTDYFDKGHVTLFENHPLYQKALARAQSN
jgi:hypothetical protein